MEHRSQTESAWSAIRCSGGQRIIYHIGNSISNNIGIKIKSGISINNKIVKGIIIGGINPHQQDQAVQALICASSFTNYSVAHQTQMRLAASILLSFKTAIATVLI